MGELVLDVSDVRKIYRGRVEALKGISLSVPKGTIFGLLGPNGAGKSTLVKILTSTIRATHCQGTMLGRSVGHKPSLQKVGYLPEHARFPSYLTGRQVIEYSAGLCGLSGRKIKIRCDELLETVGMKEAQGRKVKTYSKGMKQRIGVAQALINDPELVFLDEPTDGVDPEGRRELLGLVKRMKETGCTIFINTHLLSELERVADQVAIMAKGEVMKVGSLEDLTAVRSEYRFSVTEEIGAEMKASLSELGVSVDGETIILEGSGVDQVQGVIDFLRKRDVSIQSIIPRKLSLEELFLETVNEAHQ